MMGSLRQMLIVSLLSLKGLHHRLWSSLVIVFSVACAVAVLVSILSLTAGIERSYGMEGGPQRILVRASDKPNISGSRLTNEAVNVVMAAPGIDRTSDGTLLADPEILSGLPATTKFSGLSGTILVNGMGPRGLLLRPNLRIITGRMFEPGKNEMIVGIAAQRQFADLALGNLVRMQHGRWPIVGVFSAGGDILEGHLIGPADQLKSAAGQKAYNIVVLDLASPNQFERFRHDLSLHPNLKVTAEKQSTYYARTTEQYSGFFNTVGFLLGGLMAIGAVFGTINTLYSAVSTRAREIATLRALGFGAIAVAASVIVEAIVLSSIGAIIGSSCAWLLFNDQEKVLGSNVFSLSVTFPLVAVGLLWAVVIALAGAAPPSIRAAKVPIPVALRAV